MRRIPLSRFERLAQRLVEDSFKRLFGGQLEPIEVATRLARALEDSRVDGRAADLYTVYLHPKDYEFISNESPQLTEELIEYITSLAKQVRLLMPTRPQVVLVTDPRIARHQVKISAEHYQDLEDRPTMLMPRTEEAGEEALAALQGIDAFLIIEGRRHLPLDSPMVMLGRRTDNDIVLDSPSVSRKHAQIRWRFGRFVLYDLSGRGRTAVNGQPVNECALQPGDVISLSDILIIYGEGREDRDQTPPSTSLDSNVSQTSILPKS